MKNINDVIKFLKDYDYFETRSQEILWYMNETGRISELFANYDAYSNEFVLFWIDEIDFETWMVEFHWSERFSGCDDENYYAEFPMKWLVEWYNYKKDIKDILDEKDIILKKEKETQKLEEKEKQKNTKKLKDQKDYETFLLLKNKFEPKK